MLAPSGIASERSPLTSSGPRSIAISTGSARQVSPLLRVVDQNRRAADRDMLRQRRCRIARFRRQQAVERDRRRAARDQPRRAPASPGARSIATAPAGIPPQTQHRTFDDQRGRRDPTFEQRTERDAHRGLREMRQRRAVGRGDAGHCRRANQARATRDRSRAASPTASRRSRCRRGRAPLRHKERENSARSDPASAATPRPAESGSARR